MKRSRNSTRGRRNGMFDRVCTGVQVRQDVRDMKEKKKQVRKCQTLNYNPSARGYWLKQSPPTSSINDFGDGFTNYSHQNYEKWYNKAPKTGYQHNNHRPQCDQWLKPHPRALYKNNSSRGLYVNRIPRKGYQRFNIPTPPTHTFGERYPNYSQ